MTGYRVYVDKGNNNEVEDERYTMVDVSKRRGRSGRQLA